MIFVDSSVWIDFFNGVTNHKTKVLLSLLGKELIVVGDLVYTEVLQGFRSDLDFKKAQAYLDQLIYMPMLNKAIAIKSATHYRVLKKKGVNVRKTIDLLIATFCTENNLSLLHNDKDFTLMQNHLELHCI